MHLAGNRYAALRRQKNAQIAHGHLLKTDAAKNLRVVCRGLCLLKKRLALFRQRQGMPRLVRMIKAVKMTAAFRDCAVNRFQICINIRRRGAVHRGKEFRPVPLRIRIRIPHGPAQQIRAQIVHLPAARRAAALLEEPAHMMIAEEADILRQDPQVRMRHPEMGKIGDIVPDIEPLAFLPPADQIIPEGLRVVLSRSVRIIRRAFRKRMQKAAFNRAQPHADIPPGADKPGRAPGILIGQGIDDNLRESLLHFFSHRVHKAQERTGLGSFLFVHSPAGGASAPVVIVIL